jgi:hypothetical protein
LRRVPGLSIAVQQRMADAAVCNVVYGETVSKSIARERDRWIKDSRPGDTLWLPSLRCLVLPTKARPPRYRPGADLAATIAELSARGVRVVDASAGVSTDDPAAWGAHVRKIVAGAASVDRKQTGKRASGAKEDGIVAHWLSPSMADRLAVQRAIWTGAGTIDAVVPLLDQELQRLGQRTLYYILGRRRPHDKRAGGRPRKPT